MVYFLNISIHEFCGKYGHNLHDFNSEYIWFENLFIASNWFGNQVVNFSIQTPILEDVGLIYFSVSFILSVLFSELLLNDQWNYVDLWQLQILTVFCDTNKEFIQIWRFWVCACRIYSLFIKRFCTIALAQWSSWCTHFHHVTVIFLSWISSLNKP